MAFSSQGQAISDFNKTSSTTWTPTTSEDYMAGRLIIIMIGTDNDASAITDVETNRHLSLTAAAGSLIFTKAKEWTRGAGAAGAGVTVSCWYTVPTVNYLAGSSNLTFTFASAIAAKAYHGWHFNRDASKTIQVAGTAGLASSTSDPAISLSGLAASIEYLWFMARAFESSVLPSPTPTSGWTAVAGSSTSGGQAAANAGVFGEWLISTSTSQTSDPTTVLGAIDEASVLVAFREFAPAAKSMVANPARRQQVARLSRWY
jgi:hypothetical protein